jgi:hypothetical protein
LRWIKLFVRLADLRSSCSDGFIRRGGRDVEFHPLENCVRQWAAAPGPQIDRARDSVWAFVARQLKARDSAALAWVGCFRHHRRYHPRKLLFGVIARTRIGASRRPSAGSSGQSSTHITSWNASGAPLIGCGVLDRPLARTMTVVVAQVGQPQLACR